MVTRLLGLRLLASLLLALWAALGIIILTAYRPGGPLDLLPGIAALAPCVALAAAVVWPLDQSDRRLELATTWLGIGAVLLVTPLLLDVAQTVSRGGHLPVVPSLELGYAGVLAIATSSIFGSMGLVRRMVAPSAPTRRRVTTALAMGLGLSLIGAIAFSGGAIAAEQALRAHPVPTSAWGPTDTAVEPPHCDAPVALGPGADLDIEATADIDAASVGTASIKGTREGRDEAWTGTMNSHFGSGTIAYSRIASQALVSVDGAAPKATDPASFGLADPDGLTLDGPVLAAINGGAVPATEDLGLELFDGAQARHCQRAIDGTLALDAFLILRWLGGQDPFQATEALDIWRGELDWWVFSDGQLGKASLLIGGYPGTAWPTSGIGATLQVDLSALHRDVNHDVIPLRP